MPGSAAVGEGGSRLDTSTAVDTTDTTNAATCHHSSQLTDQSPSEAVHIAAAVGGGGSCLETATAVDTTDTTDGTISSHSSPSEAVHGSATVGEGGSCLDTATAVDTTDTTDAATCPHSSLISRFRKHCTDLLPSVEVARVSTQPPLLTPQTPLMPPLVIAAH